MQHFWLPCADNLARHFPVLVDLIRVALVAGKQLTSLNHGRYGKHSQQSFQRFPGCHDAFS